MSPLRKAGRKQATDKRRPSRAKRTRTRTPRAPAKSGDRRGGAAMGTKYACFSCGTKFYDMNRPEPICPRCGADQREAPPGAQAPPPPPPRKAAAPRMSPLLDEEARSDTEEGAGFVDADLDLDLGPLDDADDVEPATVSLEAAAEEEFDELDES